MADLGRESLKQRREDKKLLKAYRKEWVNKRVNWVPYILIAPMFLLIMFYLVIPMLDSVWLAFSTYTGPASYDKWSLTFENIQKFFTSPVYMPIMWRTIKISVIMTVACVVIGYPIAYYMLNLDGRKQQLYMMIYLAPWLINVVVKAYGWMILLDNSGLINTTLMKLGLIDSAINLLYSPFAVTVGLIHGTIVLAILPIYTSLSAIDPNVSLAAANLGASRFQRFIRVTLPLSRLGIITGSLICFASSMAAYTTPMLLGGSKFRLFSFAVYEQSSKVLNWPLGSAFSLILMIISLVGIAFIQKSMSSDKDKRGRELF